MHIDHIGIVSKNLIKSIKHWETVFNYKQKTEIIINTRQKVKVVFLEKKDSTLIKLIEPTDESSSIYTFAQKGGGLHHLCFKCESLSDTIEEMSQKGLRVLVPPQPGEAFDNKDIAFIYAKQGLNIELIDTKIKAGLITDPELFHRAVEPSEDN